MEENLEMLDIVVPVYNEGRGIIKLFDEIRDKISTPKQVIVVYDFEGDTTIPVVADHIQRYQFQIRMIRNSNGAGALNAIKAGMQEAKSEMILVMMADSSDKLDVVDTMCQKMREGYDLVCGSRYMKGGRQEGGPILKGLFARAAGLSLYFLTGIPTHDVTNSFKLYRKSMLQKIEIESNGGFEIGLEITVKAYVAGYQITEVPSVWVERQEGKSNFHMWKWLPHYLHWYFYCLIKCWFSKKT